MGELANPFPAKFSPEVMETIVGMLAPLDVKTILDPFAGIGGIHQLNEYGYATIGVEIEREFAEEAWRLYPDQLTICEDSTNLDSLWIGPRFDACVTSVTYGNRMADRYDGRDGSKRHTYRISKGAPLHENNTGWYQWGKDYRELHEKIWPVVTEKIHPGGYLLLNISNHIRGGKEMPVTQFHVSTLSNLGWIPEQSVRVETKRMRHGRNSELRTPNEYVILFRR